MDKNNTISRKLNLGLLGDVEIILLDYDAPDIYAKSTSSGIPCGPLRGDGPTYDDDMGCLAPFVT